MLFPSSRQSTAANTWLSEAMANRFVIPDSTAPDWGDIIETVGG